MSSTLRLNLLIFIGTFGPAIFTTNIFDTAGPDLTQNQFLISDWSLKITDENLIPRWSYLQTPPRLKQLTSDQKI